MNRTVAVVAGIGDPGRVEDQRAILPASTMPATTIRAAWRGVAVLFFSACALFEIGLTIPFVAQARRAEVRAAWLHRWCRFACRVLGICLTTKGSMPHCGLLVCNHLSYLDIIALSSITPCVFVAKRDVAAWPLFGWLAAAAGTIFVDRRRKLAASVTVDRMREAIASGLLVVLFPEGTSSDGSSVLPLKSALLEPGLAFPSDITVAAIDYSLLHGSVADEVCYWRDMTLAPHLLNLLTKRTIEAKLVVAPFESCCGNRKELARELRREVIRLRS